MYKICLIALYFGELPDSFQIWLNSCKFNSSINWLVYTDDKTLFKVPNNVTIKYIEFPEVKKRIQSIFDFNISLDNPYKLCDYKPAYGEIFKAELHEFDFWGYCDIDLIFGDIRKFLDDSILDKYNKILGRGHFTIFKNNDYVNGIYRNKFQDKYIYKEVFTDSNNHSFDEYSKLGINKLFSENNIPIYEDIIFSDIYIGRHAFYPYQLMNEEKEKKFNVYSFQNGQLIRHYVKKNTLHKEEVMYLHLQKRKMIVDQKLNVVTDNKILIYPNKYTKLGHEITIDHVKKWGRNKILYFPYVKYRFNNLIKKIINN